MHWEKHRNSVYRSHGVLLLCIQKEALLLSPANQKTLLERVTAEQDLTGVGQKVDPLCKELQKAPSAGAAVDYSALSVPHFVKVCLEH